MIIDNNLSDGVSILTIDLKIKKETSQYYQKHASNFQNHDPNHTLINQMRREHYCNPLILNKYILSKAQLSMALGSLLMLDILNVNTFKFDNMPVLFSKQGWHLSVKSELDRLVQQCQQSARMFYEALYRDADSIDIVYHGCDNKARLKSLLYSVYFDDYLHAWLDFLNDMHFIKPMSTIALTTQLHELSQKRSPLNQLFDYIRSEASLYNERKQRSNMKVSSVLYQEMISSLTSSSFLPSYKKQISHLEINFNHY